MSTSVNHALEGDPLTGFLRYAIPSIVGLVAWAAAPIVDGLFVANFLGVRPLAAINLVIPVFSMAFGVAYMIAIGGSVSAGKYIGERNQRGACDIFSMTVIVGLVYSVAVIIGGTLFSENLFAALGAGPELYPLMHEYFSTLLWFMPIEVLSITLYYYVRMTGFPVLVGISLVVAVLCNIGLNYLFIVVLEWGMQGAALATGTSVTVMFVMTLSYKFFPDAWLVFRLPQRDWKQMLLAAYNGLSEFINEVSAGFVAFILNYIVIRQFGDAGVAAFSVVSYSLLIGVLFFFGLSEALQAVCSPCYGARNVERMRRFLRISLVLMLGAGIGFSVLLLSLGEVFIGFFIDASEVELIGVSVGFIAILWPIFLFNGMNLLFVGYLTSVHRATQSAFVAILRALVLPLGLLFILTRYYPEVPFLYAILAAEIMSFVVAGWLFIRHRPGALFPVAEPGRETG